MRRHHEKPEEPYGSPPGTEVLASGLLAYSGSRPERRSDLVGRNNRRALRRMLYIRCNALRPSTGSGRVYCTLRILLFLVATCVHGAEPREVAFDLTITRGSAAAQQRTLQVQKGDAVRLRMTSDSAGDIHLHGYRLEARLAPGTAAEIAFKAHATGRYRIEWHAAGAPAGKGGGHHSAPLATLEVRPK